MGGRTGPAATTRARRSGTRLCWRSGVRHPIRIPPKPCGITPLTGSRSTISTTTHSAGGAVMPRTRNRLVGITLLALLAALAITQAILERAVAQQGGVRRRGSRWIRSGRSRCPTTGCSGNAIGVWVDDQDIVWIINRGSATLADNEKALELKAGDCCAGAPPVLAFDQAGNARAPLGRAWHRLRMAGVESRHLRRSPRRPSGSAATAPATRTS